VDPLHVVQQALQHPHAVHGRRLDVLNRFNPLFSGSWRIGLQFFTSCPLQKGLI
jgi:hypothetical protein